MKTKTPFIIFILYTLTNVFIACIMFEMNLVELNLFIDNAYIITKEEKINQHQVDNIVEEMTSGTLVILNSSEKTAYLYDADVLVQKSMIIGRSFSKQEVKSNQNVLLRGVDPYINEKDFEDIDIQNERYEAVGFFLKDYFLGIPNIEIILPIGKLDFSKTYSLFLINPTNNTRDIIHSQFSIKTDSSELNKMDVKFKVPYVKNRPIISQLLITFGSLVQIFIFFPLIFYVMSIRECLSQYIIFSNFSACYKNLINLDTHLPNIILIVMFLIICFFTNIVYAIIFTFYTGIWFRLWSKGILMIIPRLQTHLYASSEQSIAI
ncbi:hypothetical protein [Fundicoccus culcitae]|uniref:MacB-like periplasmic core domain-containing protein n=1 Tax=Fundicoccus culcitae TaxID=2969821 RepID=A0ABY5P7P6_9LACT|nr:hypothetical protein [Fundicoccus culcitae]UUX34473.1 hypothetical protein NRE15_02145 [Fundicoccus culcitae]